MTLATPDRFSNLCDRFALPAGIITRVWSLLEKHYQEPHRHYHNLHHIGAMLAHLDDPPRDDATTELAIWFHDVIYDPRSRDNEAESARLFEECLGENLDPKVAADVVRLILATDYSQPRTGDPDEDFMRDLDLAVLAADPPAYHAYCVAIRREYSHVPENEFTAGRQLILRKFLAGPIYLTDEFVRLEPSARRNLEAELAEPGIGAS